MGTIVNGYLVILCLQTFILIFSRTTNPFLGLNELEVQWVGEKQWTYKVELPEVGQLADDVTAILAFDGLDTFATVKLNGDPILESDNMFIGHRVDVNQHLKQAEKNVLEIDFDSALLRAREIQQQHLNHKWISSNGESARLAVRKNQSHWGWDWGPVLMTCGPWKEVRLEIYQTRVTDLWIDVDIAKDLKTAKVVVHAEIEQHESVKLLLKLALAGNIVAEETVNAGDDGNVHLTFHVKDPALWYPHGYGKQPLYEITAFIVMENVVLNSLTKKFGLRRAELVQEADKHGKSFYFCINNIPIFCGGSDWIPADNFTPRISDAKYRQWLELMVDGNQNMVRVWGGGIWEADIFYELCDELGIMVWQDFMFACGNYPCFEDFLKSVKAEATYQLKRLRQHPCIVIYAGNNEDYQIQEQSNLTYDYEDKDPHNWLKTDFPARYIYEKILPEAVQSCCPSVAYHPGSPWGDGKPTSDRTVGDLHQWNVWHGTQEKYQIFDSLGGRFNSEFGMEALPHLKTIQDFVTDPRDLYPQSRTIDFHNKATDHERILATYTVENFRISTDLEGFIYLTQLAQSEALMYAYRGWRQQWGDERKCGGALVWQLNDCWPVTSWAICDYYLRKKPAYYAMARVLAPLAIGVRRAHFDWSEPHTIPPAKTNWELYVVSNKTEKVTANIELRFISIKTGKDISPPLSFPNVQINANGTTPIADGTIDNLTSEPHVLAARLLHLDGKGVIARDMDWPQPFKYLSFSSFESGEKNHENDRTVTITPNPKTNTLRITASKPVKCLVFEEKDGVWLSDNALDLAPGDEQVVEVRGLEWGDCHEEDDREGDGDEKTLPLSWRYLGCPW